MKLLVRMMKDEACKRVKFTVAQAHVPPIVMEYMTAQGTTRQNEK